MAPASFPANARADVRDAGVLVRTELRARVRHILGEPRQLLAVVVMGMAFGVGLPAMAWVPTTNFGVALAGPEFPTGASGAAFAAVAGGALYIGAAGAITQNRLGDVGPLVRTSVPPRAVALGRFSREVIEGVAVVVPASVVLLAAVGIGARSPVAPLAVGASALPVFLASLLVGRLFGDLLRYVNRWLRVSLWTKALLFLVGVTVTFVGSQLYVQSQFDDTAEGFEFSIPALLPGKPLQAYGAVVLDPLGPATPVLGVVVALALVVTVPAGLALVVWTEARLLLDESGAADEGESAARSRGVPRPMTATSSSRVAWRYLLRTRRDPRMLAHLGPLLFGALAMGASVFTDPRSARLIGPGAAFVVGVTLAGAAFCLNPLGDDRDQLPLLLTSTRSTAVLLRGRALAGAVPGLAVVGIGVLLAVAFYDPPTAVGLALLAPVVAFAGAGTALGVGALVPKFERREYMSVERSHPSMVAVVGFFFGGTAVGSVGVLLVWWTAQGVSPAPLAVGWALYLAVVVGTGVGGYRYAVRTFDALTLDDV